jgi:hypothetical protein
MHSSADRQARPMDRKDQEIHTPKKQNRLQGYLSCNDRGLNVESIFGWPGEQGCLMVVEVDREGCGH